MSAPRTGRRPLLRTATLLCAALVGTLTVDVSLAAADAAGRYQKTAVDDSTFSGTPAARPSVMASQPNGGDVWMADSGTRVLRRFSAAGEETQMWYGGLTSGQIADISVDTDGNAWVSTATDGYVFRVPPTASGTLTPASVDTIDMGVSTQLGYILATSPTEAWVANATAGWVYRVSAVSRSITGSQRVATNHTLGGIAVNPDGEVLLVADSTSNSVRLFPIPAAGVASTVAEIGSWPTGNDPQHLTRHGTGTAAVYWLTTSTRVQRIDPSGTATFWLLPPGASPSGLVVDWDGTVWVGDSLTDALSQVKVDRSPASGTANISMGGSSTTNGIALAFDGRIAVASDGDGNYVRVETDVAPDPASPPLLSGSATVGSVLSVTGGLWLGSRVGIDFSWYRCRSESDCDELMDGAMPRTGTSAPVTESEIGTFIRADVRGGNSTGGHSVSLSTAVVAAPVATPPTVAPAPTAPPGPTPEQWAQFLVFVRWIQFLRFAAFVKAIQDAQLKSSCRRVGKGRTARTVCTKVQTRR